jgi:transcriptional regulator with XRE-family HTH domain
MDKIAAFRLRNPDMLVQALGHRLRRQRLAKGMTQQELAERAGVSVSTLKLMERQGKGSLQRLAKVAVVLGLDGDLRSLFLGQRSYESIEAVERTKRQRAPQRARHESLVERVASHMADERQSAPDGGNGALRR